MKQRESTKICFDRESDTQVKLGTPVATVFVCAEFKREKMKERALCSALSERVIPRLGEKLQSLCLCVENLREREGWRLDTMPSV